MALRTQAQTSTIRFNDIVKGGVAMIGNSHYLQSSDFDIPDPSIVNDVDGDPATSISTSADLILPASSTIAYAYLTVETGFEASPGDMTSVKFLVPGGSYLTLTNASAQFLGVRSVNDPGTRKYRQMMFDVTDLMPPVGYVSVAGGGAAGRYFVADPTPNYPVDQRTNMGGWSLIVVYRNANSINRSVVVADGWRFFDSNGESVDTDIPSVRMPNSGTVAATVGLTGTYGDPALAGYCPGCNDYLSFGIAGGALTDLSDPVAGTTTDVLNSTIGWAPNNDVSTDGGPAISGNYTAREPSTGFTPANYAPVGSQGSADYDSDIFSASGLLPADGTLRTVRLRQRSVGSDWLVAGSYFISVETVVANLELGLAPATIVDGGTATYTYTINNSFPGAILQTGLSFTNTLPSDVVIAPVPNATISCGGTLTAVAGSNQVIVSGVDLNIGQNCTIAVDVTNVSGQLNADCGSLPAGFTNAIGNFISSNNLVTEVAAACLEVVVVDPCDAFASGNPDNDGDNVADLCDLDDDNDGIPDTVEGCGNLIRNGSFESDDFTNAALYPGGFTSPNGTFMGVTYNSNTMTAWQYTLNCDGWREGGAWANAYDGGQYLDLIGNTNVTSGVPNVLYQDMPTIPGQQYDLTFHWGEDVGHNAGEVVTLNAQILDVGSNVIFDTTMTRIAVGPVAGVLGPNTWFLLQRAFFATTASTRLALTAIPSGANTGAGAVVDAISVVTRNSSCRDSDGDGISDSRDLDSDNDGIYDCMESGSAQPFTAGELNGAVTASGIPTSVDPDANGVVNYTLANSDGDSTIDVYEPDSDNDGCNDVREAGFIDTNGDGVPGNGPVTVNANGLVTSLTP